MREMMIENEEVALYSHVVVGGWIRTHPAELRKGI